MDPVTPTTKALAPLLGLALALAACQGPTAPSSTGDTTASTTESGESESGESGESGEAMDCGGIELVSEFNPPLLMFVVDRSRSMQTLWDDDGDPDTPPRLRWASARASVDALLDAWGELGAYGLQLFPSADTCPIGEPCAADLVCAVDSESAVLPALANRFPVAATMPASEPGNGDLLGYSPATDALEHAVEHILDAREGELELGTEVVVLVTDGQTNCGDPQGPIEHDPSLLAAIETAASVHGIETLVVSVDAEAPTGGSAESIPDFDTNAWLDTLAAAGGFDLPYSAGDIPTLVGAFGPPAETPTCIVDLSTAAEGPPSPEQVDLVTWTRGPDETPIPFVDPDACEAAEDGWTWIEEGLVVTFCGLSCAIMKDGSQNFRAEFGCPPPN